MLGAMQLCRVKSNVSETSSIQYFTDSSYSELCGEFATPCYLFSLLCKFSVKFLYLLIIFIVTSLSSLVRKLPGKKKKKKTSEK